MSDVLLSLLSAGIGALAALWSSERQLKLANVTAERARWRSRMRRLAADILSAPGSEQSRRAAIGLQLSTNPYDALDREIVSLAREISGAADCRDEEKEQALLLRLQLLLKHDWERAKREAGWAGAIAASMRRAIGSPPHPPRPRYERFLLWRARHPIELDASEQ